MPNWIPALAPGQDSVIRFHVKHIGHGFSHVSIVKGKLFLERLAHSSSLKPIEHNLYSIKASAKFIFFGGLKNNPYICIVDDINNGNI